MQGRKSASLGVAIIVVGIVLLLHSMDFWDFHWSIILIILGGVFLFGAFFSSERGMVFPGSLLFLLGLFFYLRYNNILYDPMHYQWPIFPIIVGAAFLLTYIFNPEDWGLLIPAGILLLVGLLFLADNYRVIRIDAGDLIRDWWPLVFIIIGLKLIVEAGRRKNSITSNDTPEVKKE
ncbi:hypothetical protein ISS30_05000 [bacterium]|nr:hypothetical protein [FCB group bacterium]MBL7191032.1 hypothetical protein [bacterium]